MTDADELWVLRLYLLLRRGTGTLSELSSASGESRRCTYLLRVDPGVPVSTRLRFGDFIFM